MSEISYMVEFTINDGKVEEFKRLAAGYIEAVKTGEPDTMRYQWFLSEDGKCCHVQEAFKSSEALLTHLANVGPSLPDLLAIAPLTRLEVYGTASADAKAALADLGAKHYPHLAGFQR